MSSLGCYTLYAVAAAAPDTTSTAAAAVTAAAASSRATNWKVIVRGLKDTADRRL